MHYYIDGYNLLFHLFGTASNDLKSQRERLIQDLNMKIEFLALDLSIVFDSHFCPGDGSRSHFHYLEILFTPQNVTADDFIIKKIKHSTQPTQKILVTNDKQLTLRARNLLASTQTLDHFLNWLDRRYSNQNKKKIQPGTLKYIKPVLKPSISSAKAQLKAPFQTIRPERPKLIPLTDSILKPSSKSTTMEASPGSMEFYLSQFENSYERFLQQKQAAKIEKKNSLKPQKQKPSFKPEAPIQIQHIANFERWLGIFEQQDKEQKGNKDK